MKSCSTFEETVKEDQAKELFTKYSGETGTITWKKLKTILDTVLKTGKLLTINKYLCKKKMLFILL